MLQALWSNSVAGSVPPRPLPPCGCDHDPIEGLKQLFVDFFQGRQLAAGEYPADRPVFRRLHGVAHGTFVVRPDLTPDLRIGILGQKPEYPIWVRFSSDVQPGVPDFKGTVGIGIKLFGVAGEKVLAPDQAATTHDLILQNHDVFFVDTAKDMCEFTCQSLNGKFDEYVSTHPVTGQIINDMKKVVDTVLGTPYWSVLPYTFGDGRYVKYKLETEGIQGSDWVDYTDPFYLRSDLHSRLKAGGARFRFLVQFQTNEAEMPLDRATVRWRESVSPPLHVATLILPQQDLDTPGQSAYGENLAFNPWHALPVHQPVGSISDARRVVYRASAEVRRHFNAVPDGEPTEPRPPEWKPGIPYPPDRDTQIVRASIHPAIGVARVGNSLDEFFVGPEVTDPELERPGFYRDVTGALKRQAARFRVYGFNASGEVVRELTGDGAEVRWTVHVANTKAAWYRWSMALDIPEAAGTTLPRRNAKVVGDQRSGLIIDGGPKSIEGNETYGPGYEFHGMFQGNDIDLGEIRTDNAGRLLFLGGRGISKSPTDSPIYNPADGDTFINADGWYDDISDGPVTAEVTVDGRPIPVDPAWVVTAPPNYGPNIVGVRTLYDLLFDLSVQAGWLPFPARVSFRNHIYPILHRLSNLQWVNRGFATQFGSGGPNDFLNSEYLAKLARDPSANGVDLYHELRRQVLHSFRNPAGTDNNPLPWPWVYGDAMQVVPANTPRQNASISPTQYLLLQAWAGGHFVPDWDPSYRAPSNLDQVRLADQPGMLDQAALTFCLADAFHPGCEVTWPIRHTSLFTGPFRIRHRPAGDPVPDYGDTLTPEIALSATGPLHAQGPGDLTRWMGLPWQADTGFCRGGYADKGSGYSYDPYIPTFWPARVPNQVLTEPAYQIVTDPNQPRETRLAAFTDRMEWVAPLKGSIVNQMNDMVKLFGDMGLVEAREGLTDDPDFPETMMVATFGPGVIPAAVPGPAAAYTSMAAAEGQPTRHPMPVRYPRSS